MSKNKITLVQPGQAEQGMLDDMRVAKAQVVGEEKLSVTEPRTGESLTLDKMVRYQTQQIKIIEERIKRLKEKIRDKKAAIKSLINAKNRINK